MADKDERGTAKASLPAGATNLKKNLATGMNLKAAEAKATTSSQVEPKAR